MPLNSKMISKVKECFGNLPEKVKVITFTQEFESWFCQENRALYEQLASISEKINLEVYDFKTNRLEAERYQIEQIPATVIMGFRDYGLRFYGLPQGYEFNSLLAAVSMVSYRESGLSAESKKLLQGWNKPTRIRVLVTLTCPYCAEAVELAHRLAFENNLITAEMIDIAEFPHMAGKYQVYVVPKVVINENVYFEGALPEAQFVDRLLQA